ncbi:hypothetical protein J6590_001728 [Homalodisca vitripennis]|nr:hypothetical protein J6590_001728 [Homalodisca vitripennis]
MRSKLMLSSSSSIRLVLGICIWQTSRRATPVSHRKNAIFPWRYWRQRAVLILHGLPSLTAVFSVSLKGILHKKYSRIPSINC